MASFLENLRGRLNERGREETPFIDGILSHGGGLRGLLDWRREEGFPFITNNSNALMGFGMGMLGGGPSRSDAWASAFSGWSQGSALDQQRRAQEQAAAEEQAQREAIMAAIGGAPEPFQQLAGAGVYEPGMNWLMDQYAPPADPLMTVGANSAIYDRSTGEWIMPPGGGGAEAPVRETLLNPEDGLYHSYGWNPATGQFDIDFGVDSQPSTWGIEVGPDGTVSMRQGPDGGGGTEKERQAAAMYASSIPDYEIVIDTFASLGDLAQQTQGAIPLVGNFLASEEYQRGRNAIANILQNYLVVTSGATVTEEEFNRRLQQVLPQPGDREGTLEDKFNRIGSWIEAIQRAGGAAIPEDARLPSITGGGAAAAPQQPQGEPVPVTTPEEANALPPGTLYITPDGQIYRR